MQEINGYEIIGKVAEGGMGTVWKARQLSLDRIVAIKLLDASSLPDQEARDRFRKEAQIAAKLNHPGIVQVHDTGEVEDAAYLVMEYVDGLTVGDMIRKDGHLSEARALDIIHQVAKALAYAWEKECLIHCDIKPDNILVDRVTGLVKVADLGLARLIGLIHPGMDSDLIIGTPNYVSPELAAGDTDLDCRTDLYSLGATLYHMVTGVLPFRDSPGSQAMSRHETDYLDDPISINSRLSAPTAWLIEKWMIKDRARRTQFWTMALKDIELVRQGNMPASPLPEPGASTVRRSPDRSVVKSTMPKVHLTPHPEGPRKLTIRKEDLPPATPPPRRSSGALSRFFGFLFSVAVFGGAIYGVLWYHGILEHPRYYLDKYFPSKVTTEPVAEAPAEEAWDDAAPAADPAPGRDSGASWRNEDFLAGARLFNQALADYKQFQQTRTNPAVLAQITEQCRKAIEHFEACRESAPEHIDIGAYIDQCYGLIADVRHSTQLDTGADATAVAAPPASSAARDDLIVIEQGPRSGPPPPSTSRGSGITFIDDEPAPPAATAPVPEVPTHRVAMNGQWEQPAPGSFDYGLELKRLLSRHVEPARVFEIDASVTLYPAIPAMSLARDAARALKQELPIRRPIATPGFPSGSFFHYQFTGDFSGARQLTLVVDRNDRIVMVQLNDDRAAPARMEAALFSPNWKVLDFVNARKRAESDGLVAHRARRNGNLIRIDTEVAAPDAAAGGARTVSERAMLMMPAQVAGLLMQTLSASP